MSRAVQTYARTGVVGRHRHCSKANGESDQHVHKHVHKQSVVETETVNYAQLTSHYCIPVVVAALCSACLEDEPRVAAAGIISSAADSAVGQVGQLDLYMFEITEEPTSHQCPEIMTYSSSRIQQT